MDYSARALQYAMDIVGGKILACPQVVQACQRHLDDLDRWPISRNHPYHFDQDKANHVCRLAEKLPHIKGPLTGQNIHLEPWQCFTLCNIFGWQRADNTRRFRKALLYVARRNSKSTLGAIIGIYLLGPDREPGPEVYSAATKRDQARVIFDTARHMLGKRPGLVERFRFLVQKHAITIPGTPAIFSALSADYSKLDGLSVHGGLVDEIHAHPDEGVIDVLETSMGSRTQPLILYISTAGIDAGSPGYSMQQYAEKVLQRELVDESFYCIIYAATDKDKWQSERQWFLANPNLGVSVDIQTIRDEATVAAARPSKIANFLVKRMDLWISAVDDWIPLGKWLSRGDSSLEIDTFQDCELAWLGADLASKRDICAFVFLFGVKDHYYVLGRYYVPESVAKNNNQYYGWVQDGYLRTCPGNVIDQKILLADLEPLLRTHKFTQFAHDPFGSHWIAPRIAEFGIVPVQIVQTRKVLTPPITELDKLVYSDSITHDNNPVSNWMLSNTQLKRFDDDTAIPTKRTVDGKIDYTSALLSALSRAVVEPDPKPKPYSKRGVAMVDIGA